jgi:hypothetical protein
VTVHRDCLGKFYKGLEDEQWKLDMERAYREEKLFRSVSTTGGT